ncbi:SdrD B-like domain-containing protein [Neolewinella agarilytica]|nr:SdrD B-like domain-containing protein [Neolewinella agarilytica]
MSVPQNSLRVLGLCFFVFLLSGGLMAQDLDIEIITPDFSSICGPVSSLGITITNNDDEDAEDVLAEFEAVAGITFLSASAPVTLNGNELDIGDIDEGESVTFTVDYQMGCDFTGDDLELILNITDGGDGSLESDAIQILTADLSIPTSTPNILGVYLGLESSVTPRVVNNGFGSLSEVTYCVSNNLGYIEVQSILVGTVDITAGGPAFSANGQDCYTITSAALLSAGLGETFDQAESIFPQENWLTVDCSLDPDDIMRRAQFGCQGDLDCQEKPQGDYLDTGVSFDLLAPRIEAEVVSSTRPGCYADEPSEVTLRLTNEGTAPALNIDYRIFTDGNGGRGMVVDLNSIMIVRESDNSVVSSTTRFSTLATDCRAPGVRDAGLTMDNADLLPGESLLITYQVTASCDCNSCDIRNKYWHQFRIEQVFDRCLETLGNRRDYVPNGRFDAFITGFPEGPTSLFADEEGCATYYITNMQLDWLTGSYPDSELEAIFILPCGIDYVPGTFVWSDRDGQTFTAESVEYVDNNTLGAEDELRVTFAPTGRPSGFNYAGGGQFDFCFTVDCSEKPEPACGNAYFDEVIDAQFDFTVDPTCAASCSTQKIWDPQDLGLRLVCPPTITGCECDGITFTDFNIERINFGIADDNNDQIPSGTVDPTTIETDRFLPGDTIKATLEGIVRDVDDDQDFTHGFVTYPFIHQNFTPLSARVAIYDASDNNTLYECTAVPVTPDYANMRVIVDYSRDALNNFGCGLPTDFLFEEGDSIAVCLVYTEKDAITDQFRIIRYAPRFYVSDDEFGVGGVFQCNPLIGQMTQIGFTTVFGNTESDFGACDLPGWRMRYDRNIGGASVDEFPYEIRPLGLPDRLVFTKPSEFAFRLDEWDILIQQVITPANSIVDTRNLASPSIPVQYFVVNGDEVTFLVGDYLRSLGLAEVPPDEGYRIYFYPRVQGNCESVEGEYDYSYQFFESVEENIFCTDEIANDLREYDFEYLGAARLTVVSDQDVIRLCSGNDVASIRILNLETPSAQNAFLYPQATGDVLITRIEDANTGNEILPNEFGIYELGNIPGVTARPLNVYFTKNSCEDETIDFVAGWDCEGYPETINDATCTDPSTVTLSSANSNVALVVNEPAPSVRRLIDLCDPVPYETQILSSDLGYVRDMKLIITLPVGQSYELGSLMFSNPSPSIGSFVNVMDPFVISPRKIIILLSRYDDVLATEGLVGSKDPENSTLSFKFNALTDCGGVSGGRATFILTSKNSCGNGIRPIRRRSGRVFLRPSEPTLDVSVGPTTLNLNACNGDSETSDVSIGINSGDISDLDSIRMILPEGINYVPGSYVPGQNAVPGTDPTLIRNLQGETILAWPFTSGLSEGDQVDFSVDVIASDVGQVCGEEEILVQAFATFEDDCDGMICSVSEAKGEDSQTVIIEKADLDFNLINGSITLNPGDGTATADFTAKLTNFGFLLSEGNTITVDIYEDVNTNGSFDDGTDTYLFSIDTMITDPVGPGQMIVINDMATFPASNICTVIGVLNPETTCTCTELPSSSFRPEIIFDYETEFDVCSGEDVVIGPMSVAGYEFEWLSVNGSDLGNLSDTESTPTLFTAPANNSGAPITLQYTLRTSNAPCFDDQVVSVTIAPAVMDVLNVQACMDAPYDLPTVNDPNATNFVWSPSAGLTISADGKFATVNNVSTSQVYTLSYDIGGGGCPATFSVNLTAINCGGANTALGDTVWFDFNEDGLQDPTEPGIGMVTVNLLDANTGAVISTTMTGPDGMYLFDMLPPGNYAVEFVLPDGFVFTMNDAAGDDENDSDADPVTGITPATFLPLDEQDFTIDAGFIPDCSLELELLVGECVPDGTGGLARRIQVIATWDGNPYTYDQFGDGNDILEIDFNGTITMVTISELAGTQTVIDEFLDASTPVTYNVSAAFQEATACTATVMSGPFDPCLVDLALTKTASTVMPTPGPYEYGDLICMDITVFNQGEQTVDNIQVQDSLPAGFAFDPTNSVDWFDISPYQLFIFPDPLAPGESAVATICVTLEMVSGDVESYTNVAEITSFTDTMGVDLSDFDEDSTPDTEFGNDAGGEPNTGSDDSVIGDGSGAPGDGDAATDEDDNDPFFVGVFDLALVKMIETDPFYAIGDTIEYSFMVVNQGNIPAENIQVVDYVPDGLAWVSTNETATPSWSEPGAPIGMFTPSTLTIPGTLAPGDTFEFTIQLQLAPQGMRETFLRTNIAEISSATGPGGVAVVDIDSTPNSDPTDDAGGVPLSDSDNTFEGDGTGDPGDTDAVTDEDDADPELVATDSVSIGSTVYIDPNNNGMQEMGESGIPGVTLELFLDANGNMMIDAGEMTPFATTVTDANGDYYFGMLVPGNYQVQVASSNFGATGALFDYGTSSGPTSVTDDDVDGNDDGSQPGGSFTTVSSPVIRLIPTMEPTVADMEETFQGNTQDVDAGQDDFNGNMTVDFGFAENVSIGSTVFADYNNNAMQDSGESGVPLVTLVLYYDADNDGVINGAETTPIATTQADGLGDYFFGGLAPGTYQVGILASEFAGGSSLEFLPMSSTDISTTDEDNRVEGDDNGEQDGGDGTIVLSPLIDLQPGEELTDAMGEDGQGTEKDDEADASGDMTIDFGFVCNLEIISEAGPFPICSNRSLPLGDLATISPSNVNGTWSTAGDGMFLDANGDEVDPARYDEVVSYMPGPNDIIAGLVDLTLTTDMAGVCPPVSATIQVQVLNVDCGDVPWDGDK